MNDDDVFLTKNICHLNSHNSPRFQNCQLSAFYPSVHEDSQECLSGVQRYLQVCVVWAKIWIAMSEVQFPLEFWLYGNPSKFYAVIEEQTKVFSISSYEKLITGHVRWEVLLYKIVFSLSCPLFGNCRDIKHETKFFC